MIYSNWMPQNIQKRLLLYILQQLSLFSEVDLPNLEEVSLNNIQLRDISIDPEKVTKVPGFNLRHGKFKNITLKGGVVEGVNVEVAGLDIVVTPSIDNLEQDIKNAQASLAQSTADLTSTVFLESDLNTPAESQGESMDHSTMSDSSAEQTLPAKNRTSSTSSTDSPRRTSFGGGMMSKALEMALSRLSVRVTDVKIKILIEPVDILLEIGEVLFSFKNGGKFLDISNVRVITSKPVLNAGHDVCSHTASDEKLASSGDESDENQSSDTSEDEDADLELNKSMVFTHEEASSIYMSATSESFAKTRNVTATGPDEIKPLLLHINNVNISFENMFPLSGLKVDVDTVKVSAVPLLPTLSLVFNSLSKLLKLKNHQLRKSNSHKKTNSISSHLLSDDEDDSRDDDYAVDDSDTSDGVFDKIHVAKIDVGLTSALNFQGEFASFEDDINVVLLNSTLKQKDECLIYGGIETIEILRYFGGQSEKLFSFSIPDKDIVPGDANAENENFSPAQKKAEVRFEYSKPSDCGSSVSSEITILISNPAILVLDSTSLSYLVNFASSLSVVSENISTFFNDVGIMNELSFRNSKFSSQKHRTSDKPNQIVVQTASLEIILRLSDLRMLKAMIFPLSFNKIQDHCSIQHIDVAFFNNKKEYNIITIPNVHMRLKKQNFNSYQFSTTSSTPQKSRYQCSNSLFVDEILISVDKCILQTLVSDFLLFFDEISSRSQKVNCMKEAFVKSSMTDNQLGYTMANSVYSSQSRFRRVKNTHLLFRDYSISQVSFQLVLKQIKFKVSNISEKFGDLMLQTSNIEIHQSTTGLYGMVNTIGIYRKHDMNETFVSRIPHIPSDVPMLQFSLKSGDSKSVIDFVVRQIYIDYFSYWVTLFDSQRTEEGLEKLPTGKTQKLDSKTDIRIALHEVAVGLVPGRLASKICLSIGKGHSDIVIRRDKSDIKTSFRDLKLLLTDDIKNLRNRSGSTSTSPYLAFLNEGYTDIGHISIVHVGVMLTNDVESVTNISISEGIWEDISIVGLKVNADEIRASLCADSAHTLIQTINDLKEPVTFLDEDKFRLRVEEGFRLPQDILDELHCVKQGDEHELNSENNTKSSQTATEDFCVVDEYYNEANLQDTTLEDEFASMKIESSSSATGGDSTLSLVESHFLDKKVSKVIKAIPLSIEVNLSKSDIYLHDGYDWKSTRKSLRKAFQSLQKRSLESNSNTKRPLPSGDEQHASDINDQFVPTKNSKSETENPKEELTETLYSSICIAADDKVKVSDLVDKINAQVQGNSNEYVDDFDAMPNVKIGKNFNDLKLTRSQDHKISASLKNIGIRIRNFTTRDPKVDKTLNAESELVSRVTLTVDTFAVLDNVNSSTWNKMVTYMSSLGDRELGTNMLDLDILNVRPDTKLSFTEAVVTLKVLPLRLHIDQDTLGFAIRFFEFKDTRFFLPIDEIPYIQKLVIDPIRVKFDYKPKKIDYAGIRAGKNAELANFFILDGSDISLKRAVVYGAHGFSKLGIAIGQIYGPYIQKYQIAGLLSGLSPVKSVVNIGNGVKDLVAIPVREYNKKDGRVVYGLQKGSKSFAKTTTYEILKLGVKLASGAQVVLEHSEEYFGGEGNSARGEYKTTRHKKPKQRRVVNDKRPTLMESSQNLRKSTIADTSMKSKPYFYSTIDEDDELSSESEIEDLQHSILVFDQSDVEVSDEQDNELEQELDDETGTKKISLYSNQPENLKDGLKSAYNALGKNMRSTGKKFKEMKKELKEAEKLQDQLVTLAKNSPVLIIRPMIGTTEALMKTLMGISNGIDSKQMRESQEKYGNNQAETTPP